MENLPYLLAAVLCDRILVEKDGTISAIRILDKVEYEIQTNLPIQQVASLNLRPVVSMSGLLMLKSGPYVGKVMLTIDAIAPSGNVARLKTFDAFELKGADQGQNYILEMVMGIQEDGLYWFDVQVNEHSMVKIPLMVIPRRKESLLPHAQ